MQQLPTPPEPYLEGPYNQCCSRSCCAYQIQFAYNKARTLEEDLNYMVTYCEIFDDADVEEKEAEWRQAVRKAERMRQRHESCRMERTDLYAPESPTGPWMWGGTVNHWGMTPEQYRDMGPRGRRGWPQHFW